MESLFISWIDMIKHMYLDLQGTSSTTIVITRSCEQGKIFMSGTYKRIHKTEAGF